MSLHGPQYCLCHSEINILSEMPRAKDEVTITPLKKHFLLLFLLWGLSQKQPSVDHFFSDLQIQKGVLLCDIRWLLHKALRLFYSDRELWLRRVTFYCGSSATRTKIYNEGGATGGRKQCFCSAACARQNAENSLTLRIIPPRQMCCSHPKMRAMCQSYSQQNSYIRETATKHKDVNTSKVNLRTVHFYGITHIWQWFDE